MTTNFKIFCSSLRPLAVPSGPLQSFAMLLCGPLPFGFNGLRWATVAPIDMGRKDGVGVAVPLSGGARPPSNTMWHGPRPTFVPSGPNWHLDPSNRLATIQRSFAVLCYAPLRTVLLFGPLRYLVIRPMNQVLTRMWANAQPDGRPAKHRWRPLFNAAKFG